MINFDDQLDDILSTNSIPFESKNEAATTYTYNIAIFEYVRP